MEIERTLKEFENLLIGKNAKYGNAYANSIGIFSPKQRLEALAIRIDDKLTRYKHQREVGDDSEDTLKDIIGYLILFYVQRQTLRETDTDSGVHVQSQESVVGLGTGDGEDDFVPRFGREVKRAWEDINHTGGGPK